jgi:outer membrane protein assembly factor BamA
VNLHADKYLTKKAELKDNLTQIIMQKPNSFVLGLPTKLILYNVRYKKYEKDSTNFQLKTNTVQKPVILDTVVTRKTTQDMKNYLFNQGYFYAKVKDTVRYKGKKAFVYFDVDAGDNYVINKVSYHCDEKEVLALINNEQKFSALKKDKEFSMSLLEDERSRITLLIRDQGYYRFSQENVSFELDTTSKEKLKQNESAVENVFNYVSKGNNQAQPSIDISVFIHPTEDSQLYNRYLIGKINVYPDYDLINDTVDKSLSNKTIGNINFRFSRPYVHEKVIYKHIYLLPGKLYSQSDYDKTISKLNELGIFKSIRINFHSDSNKNGLLDYDILMSRAKKHDFSNSFDVSSGSTYALGFGLSLIYRDRNIAKGANLLTATLSGGVETNYNNLLGNTFVEHFYVSTRYYGLQTSIDFPKFITPIGSFSFANSNVPHTIFGIGSSLMDRIDYFTLINTSANYTYNWHETSTKTWDLTPAFINIIKLPYESDSFLNRLATNDFLRNSYKQNFIEGESISFTYNDIEKKHGKNYSSIKLSFEEAGALLSAINSFGNSLSNFFKLDYAKYVKFDFDLRHYVTYTRSSFAFRFLGGIGMPYGSSGSMPYIKQYFVGGPYSLRGWRVRSLGPGSYYDSSKLSNINTIDQTGDIKLEFNGEYRFFIINLLSGSIKCNGAFFTDAGNIWLAKPNPNTPGADFNFNSLAQDIAADLGTGIRFDIASFFTVRFDFAIPIKQPYSMSNNGWILNKIAPFDSNWRSNNLVFNLSIGYPF